ncbi:MAG: O-antigen ligase family protein [Elusimicrobia bacterium]|nr:O-antigen ligase family protein [Elusimicrobiota bacterium]
MNADTRSSASGTLVLTAAGAAPLAFGPFFYDSFVLPKLALASVLVALAAAFARREGRLRPTPLDAPLAALFAAAALSAALSWDPRPDWFGAHQSYAWCLLGWAPCFVVFRLAAAQEADFGSRAVSWLAAAAIPVGIYALLQAAGLDPLAGRLALPAGGRSVSTLGSPVALGAFSAAVLPACLHLLRERETRGLGACASALALAALALSASRAAWLGGAAGALAYAAACGGLKRGRVLALGAACLIAVGALSLRRSPSDLQRVEIWRAAGRMWMERPLIGSGPESFDRVFRRVRSEAYAVATNGMATQEDAHDDWLQVLAGMGLIGLAAYAWLHRAVWKAARLALAADESGVAAALTAGLVALFVAAKLNAATWIGIFTAALMAGGLVAVATPHPAPPPQGGRGNGEGENGDKKSSHRIAAGLTVAVALAAAVAAVWFAAADRFERLGVRARAQGRPRDSETWQLAAVAMRPGEARYRLNLANLWWDAAQDMKGDPREALLRLAAAQAQRGFDLRRLDPGMAHLSGLAKLRLIQWTWRPGLPWPPPLLADARADLARAAQLDPFFPPILEDSLRAARLAGDQASAAGYQERLSRVMQKR